MKPKTQAAIHAHALTEYPRECCGVIIVKWGRERYVPCRNTAALPEEHFVLCPEDYAAADDAGTITAIVHSHPDVPARPSQADLVKCAASELPWVIVSVMPGPVVADTAMIKPAGYQADYVSREWTHGVLDCWALCRDWYQREFGISLPDPPRADGWWNDGHTSLYSDEAMGSAGFERVLDMATIRRGDLILMQIRSRNLVPNHAAIYLGDGQMLHHMHSRLSSRDTYGGYWHEVTRSIWRLRSVSTTSSKGT